MKNNNIKMNTIFNIVCTLNAKKILFIFLLFFSVGQTIAQIPQLQWARNFSSLQYEDGRAITTDNLGNVYTVGYFAQTVDFNPGAGVFNLTSGGSGNLLNIYISKLDANGNFVWAKSFVSSSSFGAGDTTISIDQSQNLCITGSFEGTVDFDPSSAVFNLASVGNTDVFIVKLDLSGNFLWAKSFGGSSVDVLTDTTIDNLGNICLIGRFRGTSDFNPGTGVTSLTALGSNDDVYISKLDSNGNFVWAKKIGSTSTDVGYAISSDTSNNIVVSGAFQGTNVDFDPNAGTVLLSSLGSNDVFILKLDPLGNYLWVKTLGGTGGDTGKSINIDTTGNIYVFGDFQGTNIDFNPDAAVFTLSSAGARDLFILKLNGTGNFIWAKKFGGTGDDYATVIKSDIADNLYVSGVFRGTVDFDPNSGITNYSSNGLDDMFINKLDNNGNFIWARTFGGISLDFMADLNIDSSNNIYCTGFYQTSIDFNPSPTCVTNIPWNTIMDAFVLKMTQSVIPPTVVHVQNTANICAGTSNGTATATVTGGTIPYRYLWSNGATTNSISGLAAGNYSVTVTDLNCNQTTQNFTISEQSITTSPIIEN